jgi:hypothetical protein
VQLPSTVVVSAVELTVMIEAACAGVTPLALNINASKVRMTVHDFTNERFIVHSPLVIRVHPA